MARKERPQLGPDSPIPDIYQPGKPEAVRREHWAKASGYWRHRTTVAWQHGASSMKQVRGHVPPAERAELPTMKTLEVARKSSRAASRQQRPPQEPKTLRAPKRDTYIKLVRGRLIVGGVPADQAERTGWWLIEDLDRIEGHSLPANVELGVWIDGKWYTLVEPGEFIVALSVERVELPPEPKDKDKSGSPQGLQDVDYVTGWVMQLQQALEDATGQEMRLVIYDEDTGAPLINPDYEGYIESLMLMDGRYHLLGNA